MCVRNGNIGLSPVNKVWAFRLTFYLLDECYMGTYTIVVCSHIAYKMTAFVFFYTIMAYIMYMPVLWYGLILIFIKSCLLGKKEFAGSFPDLAFKFQRNKMFLPRSLIKIQYCGEPPWPRARISNLVSGGQCHLTILRMFSWSSLAFLCTKRPIVPCESIVPLCISLAPD